MIKTFKTEVIQITEAYCCPCRLVNVLEAEELKVDEGVADQEGALEHRPKDARVSLVGPRVRVQGEEVALGHPDGRRPQPDQGRGRVQEPVVGVHQLRDEQAVADPAAHEGEPGSNQGHGRGGEPVGKAEHRVDDGQLKKTREIGRRINDNNRAFLPKCTRFR